MRQAETATVVRHGGRLDDARRLFPHAPEPWLDLSTGINPVPWRPAAATAFDPGPLPTGGALRRLEECAARFFGADPATVAAVPGSEIALRLLRALDLPTPIIAPAPAYGTYAVVADRAIAVTELAAWPGSCSTILLANPNNPDGRTIDPSHLRALAARQRSAGGWLVVDEAFADPDPVVSLVPLVGDDAPVVTIRSFGKFFGLAGVRLGFVVAPPAIVDRVRRLLGDWPVSAQAIAWGTAAYADGAWIEATRRRLPTAAAALDDLLARHGLRGEGASPLFRLVRHPEAGAIVTRLAERAILTRPFDYRPDWLRIGLPGTRSAMQRLDDALAYG